MRRLPVQCVRCLVALCALAPSGCAFWDMDDWAAGTSSPGSTYAAKVMGDGPLGYWRLDEPKGAATAHDSSGNKHDATVMGAVAFGEQGAIRDGTAASFDGGALDVGDVFSFTGQVPFSIEAWIEPTSVDTLYRRIASKESTSDPRHGYTFFLVQDAARGLGLDRTVDGQGHAVTTALPPLDAYTYVVATYDGTTTRLYVNGQRAAEGTVSVPLAPTDGSFMWGSSAYSSSASFRGRLDEVAVYGTELTQSKVAAHYAARQ